jgi:hypothetical protein
MHGSTVQAQHIKIRVRYAIAITLRHIQGVHEDVVTAMRIYIEYITHEFH